MTSTSGLLSEQSPPECDPDPVRVPLRHAATLFDHLTSETGREILAILAEKPRPVSEVAETVDTSTQNAMYHIDNLQDAGLLAVVDTWYSEKGREMEIYAARYDTFVLTMEASA
ncbi:MAG: helix-turn-helix domain-containing protein [Halovenus sp.]